MKRLFDIKRTKMVDELAFGHNPMKFGKTFLAFFLITIISNVATNSITNTPILLNHVLSMIASGSYTDLTTALIEFLESPYVTLPWWATPLQLFGGIFAIIAVCVYMKKFEKRKISAIGIRKNGAVLEVILGLLIGLVLAAVLFLASIFSGAVYVYRGIDIRLGFYVIGYIIFAFSEELLVHGFFMSMLARDMKPMTAIIVSSILYSIAGFSVYSIPSFLNTFAFSMLLGIFVFKRGSIWGASAIKLAWCLISGVILGSPVFSYYPIISVLMPKYNVSEILIGSSTSGFEGGLLMTVILAVAISILLLLKTKKSEQSAVKIEYFN